MKRIVKLIMLYVLVLNLTDIWGGNAAIQMQPPLGPNAEPLDGSASTVFLDCVDITSFSGRGVVNIDGGHLRMNKCHVHDCAATGIYVGGSKSSAAIEDTDVVVNGKGNKRHRYGIGVGHSGESNRTERIILALVDPISGKVLMW